MRNTPRRILLVAVFIPLLVFVLLLITLLPIISTGSAIASTGKYGMRVKDERTITVSSIPTPTQTLYLPLLAGGGLPVMESMQFFITDTSGEEQLAFLPGDPLVYHSQGTNNLFDPIQVIMQITQTGPSTPTLIYSESLSFDSGLWDHDVPSNTLVYSGIYTTTAKFVYTPYQTTTTTLLTRHVVNPPSKVITSTQQGFDKCYIPTVEEMSTWWNESPYSVFNLYMGGISFFCDDQPLDALWVHEVARQGWTFIPTWVGPQAPCSGFNHRMSANPVIAYGQGRDEALDAFTAAKDLGLLGDTVIYYDLEGYSGDAACRATVQEFLKGWNERLHELNQRAGIYGSPCRSYVTDWAVIEPPPDDVWIAHWYTYPNYYYDPDATVWGEICGLTDEMWPDHQRIKQYTGGHSENWGGTSLVIDSNVLDGEITSIPLAGTTPSPTNKGKPVVISQYGVSLDGMGLINPSQGWVLVEGRLLLTSDYGLTWSDVTPSSYTVLAADFLSPYAGWIVGRSTVHGEIALANTLDSGQTWQMQPLPELSSYNQPLATEAYIQSLDQNTTFIAFKLQSSSSFSLGRLFVTEDNGSTWEERRLPLGEPVFFLDANHGWTAGGPAGNLLYSSQDGGYTWQIEDLNLPAGVQFTIGLPHFSDDFHGELPVAKSDTSGTELIMYHTKDGGSTWHLNKEQASSGPQDMGRLSPELATIVNFKSPANYVSIPANTTAIEFHDDDYGWVITQSGSCHGEKNNSDGNNESPSPLQCHQTWKLLATEDGGLSWHEVKIH